MKGNNKTSYRNPSLAEIEFMSFFTIYKAQCYLESTLLS